MLDRQKFKALVHYVCWRSSGDPSKLGAVKLNKSLWLADVSAYYHLEESVTGARYVKRQFGPVPTAILPTLAELENEGALTVRETRHYGKRKREYLVHRDAPVDFMSPAERRIVDEAIRIVCETHTAASISDASHDHVWHAAEDGEEIPHYTVFARQGEITEHERQWAQFQLESAAA